MNRKPGIRLRSRDGKMNRPGKRSVTRLQKRDENRDLKRDVHGKEERVDRV